MSDGRDKNLNLESFFTQSPEFYEEINNHGQNMHPYNFQPQQWEYEPHQYDPRFEDPNFHNMRARGGHYPKPAYHQMPMNRQYQQHPHFQHYPIQQGYPQGAYPQYPQHPNPHYPPRRQQPGMPRPQGRPVNHPGHQVPPQKQYSNFGGKPGLKLPQKPQAPHIDFDQTEELNSMLNILGLQIGSGQNEDQPDDDSNFISKEIMLLEGGVLKVFYKELEGSYFSNIQTYGERLTKAVVDPLGKHIAVNSFKLGL